MSDVAEEIVEDTPGRDEGDGWQRTDWRGFVVEGIGNLRNSIVPLAAVAFTMLRDGGWGVVLFFAFAGVILVLSWSFALLAWWRRRWRADEYGISLEQGVLSRQSRQLPFARIHDVGIVQSPLARLMRVVTVGFETGGGGGKDEDLLLSYIRADDAEKLRRMVREKRAATTTGIASEEADANEMDEDEGRLLFAMPPRRVLTFGLFQFSLAIFAILGVLLNEFDFLLPFELFDLDGWRGALAGPGDWLAGLGPLAQVVGAVLALSILLLAGTITGVVRTALREWNYQLRLTRSGFRVRRGLLTRTDVVLPKKRIQGLSIVTRAIRYRFGWHAMSFASLAADVGGGHHTAAPFARLEEIAPLVEEAGFAFPADDLEWVRPEPAFAWHQAIRSLPTKLFLAGAIVGAQEYFDAEGWLASPLWPAAMLLYAAWRAVSTFMSLRRTRYAMDDRSVFIETRWLAPSLQIAPRSKVQTAEIVSAPWTRAAGYVWLTLGIGGDSAAIGGIKPETASQWRDAVIEDVAPIDFTDMSR